MNKAMLVGRITRDPELRYIGNNTATTSFSVAINRPFTSQNGQREADFINVVVWRKQAENVAKYCSKGSLVGVEGRIQSRSYDGKDGKKVYITEVVADNVQFLETKGTSDSRGPSNYNQNNNATAPKETEKGSDVSEDPFANFGESIEISDDQLPF